jgi:hypothetical protein
MSHEPAAEAALTTVQPKAITFPTDAKLLHAAIRGLNRLARHGVSGCGNPPRPPPAPARLEVLFLPCPGGGVHRQRQCRRALHKFGVKASIVTNNRRALGGQFVLHARARCPIIRTTVTPRGTSLTAPRHSPAVRSSGLMSTRDTAATTRKIPVAFSSPTRKARRLRCHQARAAPSLCHRAHHRTPQGRRSSRPLLSQKPCRRCRQRRPLRRRPQLPLRPRLAQRILVPVTVPAIARDNPSRPASLFSFTDGSFMQSLARRNV